MVYPTAWPPAGQKTRQPRQTHLFGWCVRRVMRPTWTVMTPSRTTTSRTWLTTCSSSRNTTRRALGRRRRARAFGTARRYTREARGNGTRRPTVPRLATMSAHAVITVYTMSEEPSRCTCTGEKLGGARKKKGKVDYATGSARSSRDTLTGVRAGSWLRSW
jgi:hypothetical protein